MSSLRFILHRREGWAKSWAEQIIGDLLAWVKLVVVVVVVGVGGSHIHIGTAHTEVYTRVEEHHVSPSGVFSVSSCFFFFASKCLLCDFHAVSR